MGEQDSARLAEATDGDDRQSESTPLLPSAAGLGTCAPPSPPPPPPQGGSSGKQQQHHHHHRRQKPARLYRRRVLVTLFSVLMLIELGTVIIQAPINAIMEDNICRQHLARGDSDGPAADRGAGPGLLLDDPRCKGADVQGELAMVRGAQLAFDVVPNVVGAIPYGLAADMYGRKPVLALGLLGVCLGYAWTATVLALPSVLPLRAVYLASAFTFIGSFGCAGVALFFTCLADVTPQAGRAGVFFHTMVAFLVAEMVGSPLSAWLLSSSPWLAMLVGLAASFASVVAMCFVPETLGLRLDDGDDDDDGGGSQEGARRPESILDDDDDDGAPLLDPTGTTKPADPDATSSWPVLRRTLTLAAASFRELWVFVLGNGRLAVLMLPLALFLLGRLAQESLLQYSTKRYGLTWADATLLMTARSLANLVLFIAVFPALGRLCLGRLRMSPLRKDLSLARVAGAVGTLGALLVALSPTPGALMCSLVVFSFGYGFAPFIRSLLNALVEQRHLAMLNSCISFLEMCGTLVAAPGLSAALGLGVRLGGPWVGLPFMLAALGFALATATVCAFRLPPDADEAPPSEPGPESEPARRSPYGTGED
ncbi:hypothetical protein RB595_010314 [Gaeumannomyces hyphopodioides]